MRRSEKMEGKFKSVKWLMVGFSKVVIRGHEIDVYLPRSLRAAVELLTPSQLKAKFPWLNTDGVVLGCHGEHT